MSSEPKDSKAERLPFEPGRKKAAKEAKPSAPAKAEPVKSEKKVETKASSSKSSRKASQSVGIPDVVSKRMARRMAVLCGVPTTFGMLTFVVSYFIVTKGIYKLPNVAVVLVSMGFFGLGVIGLSYGLLSASWDEERVGGLVGFEELKTNFSRLIDAWKSERQKQKQQKTES